MKYEILDELNLSEIQKDLRKGEKIIWEGKPTQQYPLAMFPSEPSFLELLAGVFSIFPLLILIMVLIALFFQVGIIGKTLLGLFFLLFPSPIQRFLFKTRRIKYWISDQRVFFQLPYRFFSRRIYSLPLEEIKGVVITQEFQKQGTIFFAVKNPKIINFDTHHLISKELRHQPTFEMVPNVEEVANLIRKAIKDINAKPLL